MQLLKTEQSILADKVTLASFVVETWYTDSVKKKERELVENDEQYTKEEDVMWLQAWPVARIFKWGGANKYTGGEHIIIYLLY